MFADLFVDEHGTKTVRRRHCLRTHVKRMCDGEHGIHRQALGELSTRAIEHVVVEERVLYVA